MNNNKYFWDVLLNGTISILIVVCLIFLLIFFGDLVRNTFFGQDESKNQEPLKEIGGQLDLDEGGYGESAQVQIDRLKEYLGVIEWEEVDKECLVKNYECRENADDDRLCYSDSRCEKTSLTKDPLKVEWVKLDCENAHILCSTVGKIIDRDEGCIESFGKEPYKDSTYLKCQMLQTKLGL